MKESCEDSHEPSAHETGAAAKPETQGVSPGAPLRPADALRLQRTVGNAVVARLAHQQLEEAAATRRRGAAIADHARAPDGARPVRDVRPLGLDQAADDRAAPGRALARSPPPRAGRWLQRDERFTVVPALHADDKNRRFLDPADGKVKPVWTAEGGYMKNPSARALSSLLKNGRVGGGFENGRFMYVVGTDGEVVLARRLGEPGGAAGRATGMPHPTLLGGDKPVVLAAGEVEIRGGKIYNIDNQSGHFQPTRKAMRTSVKAFLRLPPTAFHPEFKAESVHFDATGARTTKPFRSLHMLKLKARDFKAALRGLRPKAIAGKMRGKGFRSGAKSVGKGLAGLLAMVALNYFLGKWMEGIQQDFIDKQIDDLAPKIEEKLAERSDELEALLEEDPDADVFVNVQFSIDTWTTYDPEGSTDSLPAVHLVKVGFSREAWDATPTTKFETHCGATVESTFVTASQAVNPMELFTDEQTTETSESAEQPAVR